MTWDILILTMPTRKEFLSRLLNHLAPQVSKNLQVNIKVKMHNPKKSLGENRQIMREESKAEWSNFVDDDDLVSPVYVKRIFPLLSKCPECSEQCNCGGPDYIGFRLQAYQDGVKLHGPTYHSLLCGEWWSNSHSWYRDLSHLNPIRTKLALQATMSGGYGEDSRWASELRSKEVVRREQFIPEVMYHYYIRTDKTDGVNPAGAKIYCSKCKSSSVVEVKGELSCNRCGERWKP